MTAEKHLVHTAAASGLWPLHPTSAPLCSPLFFFVFLWLLVSPPCPLSSCPSGGKAFSVTPHFSGQVSFCPLSWADHTQVQLLCCSRLYRCAHHLFRVFQQYSTAHPAAADSVYIMLYNIFLACFISENYWEGVFFEEHNLLSFVNSWWFYQQSSLIIFMSLFL